METPKLVTELARRCRERGGRALLVGGGVRDWLLGRPQNDWDVEVFGIPEADLQALLERIGRVNAVGKSFGVFRLGKGGLEIEVSLPRRDSKVGPGHRGIAVVGDPGMSFVEAARRRDLTVNAMLYDPLTDELIDPWNGREDIERRVLRAVDAETFLEDPLRALRVVQLASRLCFEVDPSLVALCEQAALDELPAERVQGEWVKLLLKGSDVARGMDVARRGRILARVFPEAPDPDDAALQRAVPIREALDPEGRRLAVMLATWLHAATPEQAERTLDRLWLHKWKGYPLRERVLEAVARWQDRASTDAELRWLSTRADTLVALGVREAVTADPKVADLRLRAVALGLADGRPEPILKGRHLGALGVRPGPAMGKLLDHVYAKQLDGDVTDLDGAFEEARAWLVHSSYRAP